MSTEAGSPKPENAPPPLEVDALALPEPSDGSGRATLSDNIARLETDLDAEKEERKEERFYWICVSAFLIDVIIYSSIGSFWGFILLFMFQLIVLIEIAQKLGVDWAVQMMGWLLHWIAERGKLDGK